MHILHKIQYIFLNWDRAVPRRVKFAIGIAVYVAVFYSLYRFVADTNRGLQTSDLTLLSGWQFRVSFAVFLVAANWLSEMYKWRMLVFFTEPIGRGRAMRAVLYGTSLGLISPNRIGDFSGRSLYLPSEKRAQGASATLASSLCQNIPTFFFGSVACIVLYWHAIIAKYNAFLLAGGIVGLTGALFFSLLLFRTSLVSSWCKALHFAAGERYFLTISQRYQWQMLIACLGFSVVRYLIFVLQFWLLVSSVSDISFIQAYTAIGCTYLVNAVIPTNQLVEFGIRLGVPAYIASFYGCAPESVAAASFMLWIINLGLPSLVGALLYPREYK